MHDALDHVLMSLLCQHELDEILDNKSLKCPEVGKLNEPMSAAFHSRAAFMPPVEGLIMCKATKVIVRKRAEASCEWNFDSAGAKKEGVQDSENAKLNTRCSHQDAWSQVVMSTVMRKALSEDTAIANTRLGDTLPQHPSRIRRTFSTLNVSKTETTQ